MVRIFPDAATNHQIIETCAVYVDNLKQKNQFIAAQVPLPGSAGQFWCMLNQNRVEQIIVLNELSGDEVCSDRNRAVLRIFKTYFA